MDSIQTDRGVFKFIVDKCLRHTRSFEDHTVYGYYVDEDKLECTNIKFNDDIKMLNFTPTPDKNVFCDRKTGFMALKMGENIKVTGRKDTDGEIMALTHQDKRRLRVLGIEYVEDDIQVHPGDAAAITTMQFEKSGNEGIFICKKVGWYARKTSEGIKVIGQSDGEGNMIPLDERAKAALHALGIKFGAP